MSALLVAVCLAGSPSIDGEWQGVELRTAKGKVELQGDGVALHLGDGKFRFLQPLGEGTGKALVDAKAGRIDLVGDGGTLYGSYTIEGDTLTLALWGVEADRQAKPSTEKGGIVFVFKRKGKKLDA